MTSSNYNTNDRTLYAMYSSDKQEKSPSQAVSLAFLANSLRRREGDRERICAV